MKLKQFSMPLGVQIYKGLSHEARVRILYLLQIQKCACVADLELTLDFPQAKTSRHIRYLKQAGLLKDFRVDQWVFYYIKPEMSELTGRLLQFMDKDRQLQQDNYHFNILKSNKELAINKIDKRLIEKMPVQPLLV